MKFRKDFVTNSSSSSFICSICGNGGSGWDASLEDFDLFECVNGHVLCKEHMINPNREQQENWILKNKYYNEETGEWDKVYTKEELAEMDDDTVYYIMLGEGFPYEAPECVCPFCQFDEYMEEDMASYLLNKYKIPKEEVFAEIKKDNKRRRKLYPHEYIAYIVKERGVSLSRVQQMWKHTFKSYQEFRNSLEKIF